ncbi:MAG: DUF1501 domain-containing protein [Rhodospirillaceae bacterium]|nr:DUF1501 domain-containing protein [Rhodospirillaceae bacterium]
MRITRRNLLLGASGGAFMASAGPGLRVSMAAESTSDEILVVMFARGGIDGLQLAAPSEDSFYQQARPSLAVQSSGANAGIAMANGLDGVDFFMNPGAPELNDLYTSGDLALIHAAGVPTENRSHFKTQDMMERGVADNEDNILSGWLTRHVETLTADRPLLSTISTASSNPISLLGYPQAVSIPDVNNFNVVGGDVNANVIAGLNSGSSAYQQVAQQTIEAINTVQLKLEELVAAEGEGEGEGESETGPAYTNGPLSSSLRNLAALIKMDVGLDVATVDQGGWDHHNNLLNEFRNNVTELSQSLSAFWEDVAEYRDRITLVFMTEFGRRLNENASAGTDHGSGSIMMVLSGNANGGQMYGAWPGLSPSDLDNGDLAVTTDYRQVIAEILAKRHNSPSLDTVFPTVAYSPLGIINGDDSAITGAAVASNTTSSAS